MDQTILVTGSSGYIGSALCVALARRFNVVGLDKREPPPILCQAAPTVQWNIADVSDNRAVNALFKQNIASKQPIDWVLHFAAFYHYGSDWRKEYEHVNIQGTRNIMAAACCWGVRRVIFASSIGALIPPPEGRFLRENAAETGAFPYSRSKAMGEAIVAASHRRTEAIVLRIGGVFSDWCELPPLYSLIKIWGRRGFTGKFIPGRGKTGFPFIHRKEVVKMISRIIERDDYLESCETLFCAEQDCTCHETIYPIIRRHGLQGRPDRPIFIPTHLVRLFLTGKHAWNRLNRRQSYERAWMLDYVDRPLAIDATHTREKLQWSPDPRYAIVNRLPVLMRHFQKERTLWEMRNIRRNEANYEFHHDENDSRG